MCVGRETEIFRSTTVFALQFDVAMGDLIESRIGRSMQVR